MKTNINNVIQLPDFTERSRIKDRPNHIRMSSFHIRAYTVTDSNCSMFVQHESGTGSGQRLIRLIITIKPMSLILVGLNFDESQPKNRDSYLCILFLNGESQMQVMSPGLVQMSCKYIWSLFDPSISTTYSTVLTMSTSPLAQNQ